MSSKRNKKVFVLDTSVLVYDYNALRSFKDCEIVLPITILEELDKLKKMSNEAGRNARVVIRDLDRLIENADLSKGLKLPNNVLFKIDSSAEKLNADYGDNKILECAKKIQTSNKTKDVILLSRDINLRVRAKSMGLSAQGYEREELAETELYKGFRIVENPALGHQLLEKQFTSANDTSLKGMFSNECVLFVDKNQNGISTGRKIGNDIRLITDKCPWGLPMRGKEQLFAADLLLDTNVPLVSIVGRAGGGKSLISLAAGLELVLNQRKYGRFIIYRPIQVVGNDIGYLPGTIAEKLEPHFAAIHDSMQYLFSGKARKSDAWKEQLYQYLDSGIIQQEALTYIRGRSISNAFIMIDECQNLDKEEIKAILTRAGEGSKIVLTGDIDQIDRRDLDPINNGLTHVIDRFKSHDLAGHITLLKGERSELATLAAKIL